MDIQTLQYKQNEGWSNKFPEMDSSNTLILVFAAPEFKENLTPFKELAQYYPNSKIIGCSTAGEIAGAYIYDHSLSVAIVKFEKTLIEITKTELKSASESFSSGEKIAKKLNKKNLRAIFVLSNGLNVNGTELVRGLNSVVDEDIIITGGLAGDGKNFKETWSLFEGDLCKNHVVAVGFYGNNISIGHASRGGWDIFGPERRITSSKNNILYELDGEPALALYKEYLGDRVKELPASGLLYPLAIRKDLNDANQLVRTILAVDEETQSLIFAGDIPNGHLAQLMRANFERIIASANEAGEIAVKSMVSSKNHNSNPILAIAVSCVGRRLLLGERTEEETESTLESLPENTQQVGFYSYGELSPHTTGRCGLHNQTMTLTTLQEN